MSIPTNLEAYVPRPMCSACGTLGRRVHSALIDRLFSIKGQWSMNRCSNASCDLHWLDPAPPTSVLPSFYSSYHTHSVEPEGGAAKRLFTCAINGYLSDRFGYQTSAPLSTAARLVKLLITLIPTLRDEAAARVSWLDSKPDGKLLEVGFGNGATLSRLKTFGWSVSGIEFDPVAVDLARNLGIDARLGSLEDGAYPDAAFDAVVSSHLLEHLPDPQAHLKECHRILRPGGRLVLTTPNSVSLGHFIFGKNWRGLEPPRHLHLFGPASLLRLAKTAGFQSVTVSATARGGHIISQSIRLACKADPAARRRAEVELLAFISWLSSVILGNSTGEELRLECKR
jgi:SAM-dependent methyltransferase